MEQTTKNSDKLGLHTNEAGTRLVNLFRLTTHTSYYQPLIPYLHTPTYLLSHTFFKQYPIRVTSVEVEKGAKKAKKVRAGRLYTDGEKVVSVVHVGSRLGQEVTFNRDLPFHLWCLTTSFQEFLAKYCWELDDDSIVVSSLRQEE
jgi:hypothetical protein